MLTFLTSLFAHATDCTEDHCPMRSEHAAHLEAPEHAAIPAIDARAPQHVAIATFALG